MNQSLPSFNGYLREITLTSLLIFKSLYLCTGRRPLKFHTIHDASLNSQKFTPDVHIFLGGKNMNFNWVWREKGKMGRERKRKQVREKGRVYGRGKGKRAKGKGREKVKEGKEKTTPKKNFKTLYQ